MAGTLRTGLVFGLAVIVVLGVGAFATLVTSGVALPVVLLVILLLGGAAGYSAARTTRAFGNERVGRGLVAGLVGGMLALLGSVVVGVVFAGALQGRIDVWLGRLALVVPIAINTSPWLRGGGLIGGSCLGVVNLVLMAVGGAVGGSLYRR